MKTEHLNDRDIQLFIFDSMNCNSFIKAHIDTCDSCKKVADSYQLLSKDLKEQSQPIIDFNLEEGVLSKIPTAAKHRQTKDLTRIGAWILLTMGIIVIVLNAFNIDLKQMFDVRYFSFYFIISTGLFITILWSLDMINSFHKRMNQIKFSQ